MLVYAWDMQGPGATGGRGAGNRDTAGARALIEREMSLRVRFFIVCLTVAHFLGQSNELKGLGDGY